MPFGRHFPPVRPSGPMFAGLLGIEAAYRSWLDEPAAGLDSLKYRL
jgi:hypothetical protein